jgi:uncharacterized protein with PIN domain
MPPESIPYSFPTCARCRTYLVRHSEETVPGPDKTPISVQVYECPACGKFCAEEMSARKDEGAAA